MATPTYALYAAASFHGEVVEESFVRTGEPLQIGNSPALGVPVPAGFPYIALVTWQSHDSCSVRDGQGNVHVLTPSDDLDIDLGAVSLRLSLVQQYRLRRTEPMSVTSALAWFAVIMMFGLVTSHGAFLGRNYCLITSAVGIEDPRCFSSGDEANNYWSAEYLARLLREDLDGEDQGVIEHLDRIERPDAERETEDFYMPAGNEGPITDMGGAEETAPEPIRTDEEDQVPVPREQVEEQMPLFAENGTPIQAPEEETEAQDGDEGLEVDPTEEAPDVEAPAEEDEGWGIPDWYDEEDKALEELEIELMLRVARQRLRIDPNDPASLSLLSYYQYLAGEFDAALETYDKFIELYPEEAAGYNNKALVYKRRAEYEKEEGLYRTALYYQPQDVTAMNNLAVNLSHQGRYEEALAIMDQLEVLDPGEPYNDLHRSKIHAEIGNEDQALDYLRKALEGMARLDTLHHIEFRQDIRLDPSFEALRATERFRAILHEFYGEHSPLQE